MNPDERLEFEGRNVYTITGISPLEKEYSFTVLLNSEFAEMLLDHEDMSHQESIREHICEDILTHDMADVRFYQDSILPHSITVAYQATGLDIYKGVGYNKRSRDDMFRYCTHNVDVPQEAIEIIAAFNKCAELGYHALELGEV